jgi:prepilin-type N-terminal cleavage/methylation domain-containing protein
MFSKRLSQNRPGFTLVELLVVVLIIAILAAIALPLYLSAVNDAEKKTALANMQTIANGLQAYRIRDPSHLYPTSLTLLTSDLNRDFSSMTDPAGPGSRYYIYNLATNPGTCTDSAGITANYTADTSSPLPIITDSVASDGCFVPGATSE